MARGSSSGTFATMTPGEIIDAKDLIKSLNYMLHTLQSEGRFPSYGLHFNLIMVAPDGAFKEVGSYKPTFAADDLNTMKSFANHSANSYAVRWDFHTWRTALAFEFEWERRYTFTGPGFPLSEFQIIPWETFIVDLNDLMLQIMEKYPALKEFTEQLNGFTNLN